MEQQQKILTFWDHLEELRHVLFRIAVAVVFLMLVAFLLMFPPCNRFSMKGVISLNPVAMGENTQTFLFLHKPMYSESEMQILQIIKQRSERL